MQLRLRVWLGAGLLLLLLGGLLYTMRPRAERTADSLPSPFATSAAMAPPGARAILPTVLPSRVPTAPPFAKAVATAQSRSAAPRVAALPLRSRFLARPDDEVTMVTPGVAHIQRVTDDPLRINILLFDLTAPEFALRPALGDGWLAGRYRTSYMAQQNGAIAAVNGDLFSSEGTPQGLMIVNSQVVTAPKYRATFAWSPELGPFIGYFTREWTWVAEVIAPGRKRAPLHLLNTFCPMGSICLFNHYIRYLNASNNDARVVLDATGEVQSIVQGKALKIPRGVQVLQGKGQGAKWLLQHLEVGDTVDIDITTDPLLSTYTQAISGGPIILQDGEFVQDCLCALRDCSEAKEKGLFCEDFTTDWKQRHYLWVRMPRTGIGFDKERQTLVVAVVDGYQRGYSRGITQEEFADLLREFGAYTAMELDGGGSSTMVLQDEVVNQPSDETGERYVANALLFFWNSRQTEEMIRPSRPLPVEPQRVE
ncbi:MAG: phosphodiester glycosidase family protein [Chloroflexales bacterium]|nr:phosphodiester glycosidase family protein [Chloroflexales bacterium]